MKRILSDDVRATTAASDQFHAPDPTSAGDWAATIRAASMRARKAVTEGYLSSPPSSPLKQAPVISLTAALGYPPAARESIRQIFPSSSSSSSFTSHSPLPSPSKRKRSHPDSPDDDVHSVTPSPITPHSPDRVLETEHCGDDMEVDSLGRPMKPLRRSGRIREVSPLPPSRSLFPCETEMNSHQYEPDSRQHALHTALPLS